MNKEQIKKKALSLTELCLSDSEKYAHEFTAMYDSGEFTEQECEVILKLCNVYSAVKTGIMSREDGIAEQKIIFSGGNNGTPNE